jgi:hypothetical protein
MNFVEPLAPRGRLAWMALTVAAIVSACGGDSTPAGAPSLTTNTFQTAENKAVTKQLAATDPNGAAITFSMATNPQHGTVSVSPDGSVTYTPAAYFHGTDTFSVGLTDAKGGKASALVTVAVSYVNYPPVAHNDRLRIPSAKAPLSILANDENPNQDALTVTILTQPRGGTVSVQNGTTVSFQPESAFAGPTSFTYRITNPSGSSSDATVQLVVGDFQGLVFLADETTIGTPELHFFDGFGTVRLSTPLQSGAAIQNFTMAADGRHVAYIVTSSAMSQVLVADIVNPGSAQLIYSGVPGTAWPLLQLTLNHDASFALVTDANYPSALKTVLVQSANGTKTTVAASNPSVLTQLGLAFNPISDEFYIQGQIGGSPPPASGTGFTTLFAATTATPDPLVQIGANYGGNHGGGSGNLMRATSDGRHIVHASLTYGISQGGNTTIWDLLVNDRATNTETYLYRKFGILELVVYGTGSFDINSDGSGVCFGLNTLPATASFGAGQIWLADPRAPGSASAVTPLADYNFGCQWASDAKTIVYQSATGTAPAEPWVVNTSKPGAVSRLREPLASGYSTSYFAIAQKTMTAVIAVQPVSGGASTFFRAAIDAPGRSTNFYSAVAASTSAIALDARGTSIQFLNNEAVSGGLGSIHRLHWASTQTSNYDLTLSRLDSSSGVLQAAFVPE